MATAKEFPWWYVPACGGLWGVGATLADSVAQPVGDLPAVDLIRFTLRLLALWMSTGMVWAAGAKMAEERPRPSLFILGLFIVTWLVSFVVNQALFGIGRGVGGDMAQLMMHAPPLDMAAYLFWANLFYGGLYITGYFATRRTLRLRRRLADLRLARNEAASRLGELRLQAVRGQIQPEVLLEALETLQARYDQDIAAGNALFDIIIDFLRAAMPGLRSGNSTLAAEFTILAAYAALREALDDKPPPWRLALSAAPADLPFPPLRLLPVLDQISRNAPLGSQIDVRAEPDQDSFVFEIAAHSPGMADETLRRLQTDAYRVLGLGSTVQGIGAGVIAKLRFPSAVGESLAVISL